MNKPKIKICGITNLDDLSWVVEHRADFAGFNFYPHSPRYVTPDFVSDMLAYKTCDILKVGVFVNDSVEAILEAVEQCSLDIIQLHGDETAEIAEELGVERVWKSFNLLDEQDLAAAIEYPANAIVVDTRSGSQRGGTGKVGNWNLAAKLARKRRLVLAGGLREDNIGEAIRRVQPEVVDVCSGVEKHPGAKDPDKLARFVKAVRQLETTDNDTQ